MSDLLDDQRDELPPQAARFLLRFGIDAHSPGDMREFTAMVRWALAEHTRYLKRELEREIDEREQRNRRWNLMFGCAGAVVTAILTSVTAYLAVHL